eukprot:g4563.t1
MIAQIPTCLFLPRVQMFFWLIWGTATGICFFTVVSTTTFGDDNKSKDDCDSMKLWLHIFSLVGFVVSILGILIGVVDCEIESVRDNMWKLANFLINPLLTIFHILMVVMGWSYFPIESSNEHCGDVGEWSVGFLMFMTGDLAFVGGSIFFTFLTYTPFCCFTLFSSEKASGDYGGGIGASGGPPKRN